MKFHVIIVRKEPYEGDYELSSEPFDTLEKAIEIAKVRHKEIDCENDHVRIEVGGWND